MPHVDLGNGLLALFDEEDWSLVRAFKWYPLRASNTTYVHASRKPVDGKDATVSMHRLVMRAKSGQMVDHVNGNGLDNRRSNLRFATPSQNAANSRLSARNTSGYKGVVRMGDDRWAARIKAGGKVVYLGTFRSPEDAARAYNAAALRVYGEFARPNQVTPLEALREALAPAGLSPRELEVALAVSGEGLSYGEVAQRLGIARATVGVIIHRIKLKVQQGQEAAAEAEAEERFEERREIAKMMKENGVGPRHRVNGEAVQWGRAGNLPTPVAREKLTEVFRSP